MPGFNRTGPRGQGPLTGGGFGKCNSKIKKNSTETNLDDRPGKLSKRIRKGNGKGLGRK